MQAQHDKRYPNEDAAYRDARTALLQAELELDAKVNEVATLRAALPDGGAVKEDYVFRTATDGQEHDIRLSELFAPGKDSLFLYSFMWGPGMENPCPACTSAIDGFNGVADHIGDRINVAIVAKNPIGTIMDVAKARGWTDLRFLSSADNSYNDDYFAHGASGNQIPAANIFVRRPDGIRHFWGAEMLYVDRPGHPRHVDQIWPIWQILDLTPEGRGTNWFPSLSY